MAQFTVTVSNGRGPGGNYVYVAWASDASGTGFTTTFNASLDYVAIKSSAVPIASLAASDFTGLWKCYKGQAGAMMAWHGAYSAGHTYVIGDGVLSSEGRGFIALGTTTGNAPPSYPTTSNAYWSLFAERGGADATTLVGASLSTDIIADPGSDTKIPTEQAVREGLTASVTSHVATWDGWAPIDGSWSYNSANTITVPSGAASKYCVGMRIMLTQTTAKYFIITKVEDTMLTVYGGTDYTVANAAITSPYYSMVKCPFGFPMSPAKWSIIVSDANNRTQASPNQNTWYNLGSLSIALPIGAWDVSYSINAYVVAGSSGISMFTTLSTANNSESDAEMSCQIHATATSLDVSVFRRKFLDIAAAATYYLNAKTDTASMNSINFNGASGSPTTKIRATCAYL